MSEVNTGDDGDGKGKHKKVRAKKSSTHIDMTPMVDLAFLLLTFFIMTTTFSKPKTMEINMPVKKELKDSMKINNAITALLSDKHKIFWYYGEFKPDETQLQVTDFSPSGIRKILLDKNASANERIKKLEAKVLTREMADSTFKRQRIEIESEKAALFVLIKTDDKAKYKDVIDMLDECNIANVGKYAIVDIMQKEFDLINNYK